ncbi:MAG: hypothetical protein LW707_07760 [Sphingobacteriales bacterium]|jgi:ribosome maturation factor RimP|nr:hypothetical protein [Sphingobacteriales bacterium]
MVGADDIKALVVEHFQGSNCFLVEVKLSPSRLVVAVDSPTGITIDQCSGLSRFLINTLEDSGFLETHEIEVGSPGMDSALMVPQQYLRRIGRELRVFDAESRETTGVLKEVRPDAIVLLETKTRKENKKKITTEHLHEIPFAQIREAKLIINYKFK